MAFYCFKNLKQNCPKCSHQSFKYNIEEIKEKIETKTNLKLISTEYKNCSSPLELECPIHGLFKISWNRISAGDGCKYCGIISRVKKRTNSFDKVKDKIEQLGYTLVSNEIDYKNNKTKLKIRCPKHGIFNMIYNSIDQGQKCRKCISKISTSHQQIIDYLKTFYNGKLDINDREILNGKELDIYIPEFNVGIEFDGLYWHNESNRPKAKCSNMQKIELIQSKSIKFLAIFEDEWKNPVKQELLKAMIKHRLGFLPENKLRASKLELRKLIKNKEYSAFFDKYHLDGHTVSSFAYGLFYQNELVSCMSFRKSFSDKCWEIARFATDYNYTIHGNAGKMIKAFKVEFNERLVTYSNNRLSLGDVYMKNGFKEITKTKYPSYYYTDSVSRLWRFKCRRINDPEILAKYPTEKAQAEGGVFSKLYLNHDKPLYKVYDYGHRKWELS